MFDLSLIRQDGLTRANKFWNGLLEDFEQTMKQVETLPVKYQKRIGYPVVDVSETDKEMLIEASVPGMDKEGLSVEVTDNLITITGQKQERIEDAKYHYRELHKSYFSRSIAFPTKEYDTENIKCSLSNGLLKVSIPKKSEVVKENVKKVEISVD